MRDCTIHIRDNGEQSAIPITIKVHFQGENRSSEVAIDMATIEIARRVREIFETVLEEVGYYSRVRTDTSTMYDWDSSRREPASYVLKRERLEKPGGACRVYCEVTPHGDDAGKHMLFEHKGENSEIDMVMFFVYEEIRRIFESHGYFRRSMHHGEAGNSECIFELGITETTAE
ncbi:MAG: hypothetical protein AAB592_05400 [Patescibacteria group bacterium]